MESKITYFEKPGAVNTGETLRLARERADALGIQQVVVASTRGDTALKAMDVFAGLKVVVVGIATGPREHDEDKSVVQPFPQEARQVVEAKGGVVLNTTHAFGGINRALRDQLDWKSSPASLIAAALRIFGHGMKVTCEVAMMAADSGIVNTAEDAVVIAGSGRGADTAIVLRPVNTTRLFDLKVKEIICKPRL
jgi:hypothetical protein